MGKNSECKGQRQQTGYCGRIPPDSSLQCHFYPQSSAYSGMMLGQLWTRQGPDIVFAQQWSGTLPLHYSTHTKSNCSKSS